MTLSGKRQAVISRLVKYPALAVALTLALFATQSAHAQNYHVLHDFGGGTDGAAPQAGLVLDDAGNLYGTTTAGGASNRGTVFKLDTSGTETLLYSFKGGADGATPAAGLVLDASGNLYGTTTAGGFPDLGTVFKLDTTGKESLLHTFTGSADGGFPQAGLILDAAGNFYGTTMLGGASNRGTVFKLDTTGKETVLYAFTGHADGGFPDAPLILDASGNLYGTTSGGGRRAACFVGELDCGVVFKLDTAGTETVLYTFMGAPDGGIPGFGGLVFDAEGNLYGTTTEGGANDDGVVFRLDTAGSETILFSFGNTGVEPFGGLVMDAAGNLYGTTINGDKGFGTVFELDMTRRITVLHAFAGGTDGASPYAGLVLDAAGNLFGTTSAGGASNVGTVFDVGIVLDSSPRITSISPASVTAGSGQFTLTVNGANFSAGSVVSFDGTPLVTNTAGAPASLSGTVTAALVATAGTYPIAVSDGGSTSNSVNFTVVSADEDFTFGTITRSPSNATVTAGGSVTYTIPITAVGGFSSTVTLTCTSGLPSKASCSEASATPTTPATLTISTQANSLAPKFPAADRNPLAPLTTGVTFLIACLLLALQIRRQPRPFRQLAFGFSLAALVIVFALAGCSSSGGGGGSGGGNNGTPSGAYTVTITGTSGSQTHTTTVALTVSP